MPLGAGSIAFVGFNADGNDDIAFVALNDIPAGTVIFFSDNEWNGTAFNTGESYTSWTAPAGGLAAGTVVTISDFTNSVVANLGTAAAVTVAGSANRGISNSGESLYAYVGPDATTPTTFLTAVANTSFSVANGVLDGTGLTAGVNALDFAAAGIDIAAYAGARSGQASFADYTAQLNNPANWITQDAAGDQSNDGTAPDVPFSTTPLVTTAPFSLANYVRVGRYDLPEPTRTAAPANNLLAQEASAVTYDPDTGTLFVLGDGGTAIVQVSLTGQLIDTMTLAPGSSPQGTDFYDPEGLTYVGGGKFVMTEERDRNAVQFTYAAGTTLTRANASTVHLGTNVGNIGLEGVSYDPQTGGFIFVKEKDPESIFQTGIDFTAGTATNGSASTVESTDLFNPALLGLADFADVYALSNVAALDGQAASGHLLVLSQESGKIVEVDRAGNVLSTLTIQSDPGNPLSVVDQQHEGVTMGDNGVLYVVSENGGGDFDHPQLWVYAPSTVPNQAPTALALTNQVTTLAENTSTVSRVKVADIAITDDGLGTNNLSLSGADAAAFEVDNTGLYLKAGTTLNFEAKTSYAVTVAVDDPTLGGSPDATTSYTLSVSDVTNENPGHPQLYISEVAPWSSGNSPVAADWFEVTNSGSTAVNITGWRMDDNSDSFGSSVALNGITSIGAGQSVIFIETDAPATAAATFRSTWFGANPPAGLQIGSYSGSGVGLSTGGDHVNLFDASGVLQANVTFGASPTGPFTSFNNAAGLNGTAITTPSAVGQNGAFAAAGDSAEIGSPGSVGRVFISEVAPWSSGDSPVGADWFEVTNTSAFAVDLAGWKMDDSSGSPAAAVALNGVSSIAPGESVIFIESDNPAAARTAFVNTWFGGTAPAGLQIGTYTGSGVGLSTGGDAINLYDGSNVLQASVTFGASPTGPFTTFDNAAALNGVTISQLSSSGVDGGFIAAGDAAETGSPGTIATRAVTYGYSNVYLEGDGALTHAEETNLGDLTADANAYQARQALGLSANTVMVSLTNGGELGASIGSIDGGNKVANASGTISQLDVENALGANGPLMVFDTTPQGLLNILNYGAGLAGDGGFLQLGGLRFSYDPALPAGSRVRNVALYDQAGNFVANVVKDGVVVAGAPATITGVVPAAIANGGNGYPFKANATDFRYLLADGTVTGAVDPSLDFTAAATMTTVGAGPTTVLGDQQAFEGYLTNFHGSAATAYNTPDTPAAQDRRIENLAVRPDAVSPTAPDDFFGGGVSSMLFQHTGGTVALWTLTDGQVTAATGLGNFAATGTAIGTGDMTGDGIADVLFRGADGTLTVGEVVAGRITALHALGVAGSGSSFATLADVNGDHIKDVVLRNADNTLSAWTLQGGAITGTTAVGTTDAAWTVAGAMDLNGDGTDDLVFTSNGGDVAGWLVHNGTATVAQGIGSMAPGWSFAAIGDLTGDGIADLAFKHSSGAMAYWQMQDGTVIGAGGIGQYAADWSFAGAGDFNGDGTTDLAFQHSSGAFADWELANGAAVRAQALGSAAAGWTLVS